MNIPSATPPVAGPAVNTTATVAANPAANGGIADLFSALLASLQATLTSAQVDPATLEQTGDGSGDAVTESACIECAETVSEVTPTVDDAEMPPETGDDPPVIPSHVVKADLAALLAALSGGPAQPAPVEGEVEPAMTAPPAAAPTVTPQASDAAGGVAVAAQAAAEALPEDAVPVAFPHDASTETADESEAATTQPALVKAAQAPVARAFGRVAVEAVRQGQSEAAQAAAPGRTIRQLVHDAIATARKQAESSDVAEAKPADAPDAPSGAKRPAEPLPELRPAPSAATASPKASAPSVGVAVAPTGGDAPAPDAVTAQSRETARAHLPQSVDVRDVGDFTVRSVRYLGGRTEDTVTVRLVPRSLGELQVAVRASADGLEIVLTAANHVTRERLEGQLVGLREQFAREGIDVKGVSVQAPPTFDLTGQMPSQHQHHQHPAGHATRLNAPAYREPDQQPPEEQQHARGRRPHHDGGLNMFA